MLGRVEQPGSCTTMEAGGWWVVGWGAGGWGLCRSSGRPQQEAGVLGIGWLEAGQVGGRWMGPMRQVGDVEQPGSCAPVEVGG